MMKITQTVKEFLLNFNISNTTVVCAVSGGADSVCLLDILNNFKNEFNLKLIVAHLNHNWRALESKRDEDFVKNLAQKYNLSFYSEILSTDIKKNEVSAREARYEFFKRVVSKFKSNVVMLAHNKNDNAETLLYRVIKGTALKGLCSIPKNRDIFYRPLLEISRDEIEKYVEKKSLEFVFDSSNDDIKYKRNLIRNRILPLLEQINPDVISALNSLSNVSNMQFEILQSEIDRAKEKVFFENKIRIDEFLKLSRPLQLEIMNNFLQGDLKNRDFKRIEMYADFIKQGRKRISLNSHLFLENKNGFVFKEKPFIENICTKQIAVSSEGVYEFLEKKILIEKLNEKPDFSKKDGAKYLNTNFDNLVLRTRRSGDVFCPFGSKTEQKLKDYLIKKKISRQERDNLILLACGNEILCILGVEISQKCAVENNICYKIQILGA